MIPFVPAGLSAIMQEDDTFSLWYLLAWRCIATQQHRKTIKCDHLKGNVSPALCENNARFSTCGSCELITSQEKVRSTVFIDG